jgi:hypothetical protein
MLIISGNNFEAPRYAVLSKLLLYYPSRFYILFSAPSTQTPSLNVLPLCERRFIWLRIGSSEKPCKHGNDPSGSIKC